MRALSENMHSAKRSGLGFIRDLFYVPKHGKLPELSFFGRIVLSIAAIFGCLSAMGLSAYAYFQANEVAAVSALRSANYTLEILVNDVPLTDGILQGKDKDTYKVTLRKHGTAQTGFCIITVEQEGVGDVVYHTQQIGADKKVNDEWTEAITFTVQFDGDATLIFEPHWGTSSNYQYVGYEAFEREPQPNLYIVHMETLSVAANALSIEEHKTPAGTQNTAAVTTTATACDVSESKVTLSSSTSTSTTRTTETTTETSAQTQETTLTTVAGETTAETTATTTGEVNTTSNEEN